jgi:hypothetical protein
MRKQFGVLMNQPFPRTLPKKMQEDIHRGIHVYYEFGSTNEF